MSDKKPVIEKCWGCGKDYDIAEYYRRPSCSTYYNPFLQEIWDRLHKRNQNCLIIVTGEVGSGKSLSALHIASRIDPTFNETTMEENRLIFKPQQFSKTLSSAEDIPKYSALVFDEAGIGVDSRMWYSFNNKAVSDIMQIFRFKNLMVIFTVPYLQYIDSKIRPLFQYYIETEGYLLEDCLNKLKIFKMSYNSRAAHGKGQLYYKYPYYTKFGITEPYDNFYLKKVGAKIEHKYNQLSEKFKNVVIDNADKELKIMESYERKKNERNLIDMDDIEKKVLENLDRYSKLWGGKRKVDVSLVMHDFKIGQVRANMIKRSIEERIA